jgi:hypothetical protein
MSDPELSENQIESLREKLGELALEDPERQYLLQLIDLHRQFARSYSSYSSSDGSGLTVETKTQISIKPPPSI